MRFFDMACVDCGAKLLTTTRARARKQGWTAWTGGARCGGCGVKAGKQMESAALAVIASRYVAKLVRCSACEREFRTEQEYTDGYRPGMHWIKPNNDQREAARSRRVPLPLCPGWDRAGVLLGEAAA